MYVYILTSAVIQQSTVIPLYSRILSLRTL
jgi:hypothetical protein